MKSVNSSEVFNLPAASGVCALSPGARRPSGAGAHPERPRSSPGRLGRTPLGDVRRQVFSVKVQTVSSSEVFIANNNLYVFCAI